MPEMSLLHEEILADGSLRRYFPLPGIMGAGLLICVEEREDRISSGVNLSWV